MAHNILNHKTSVLVLAACLLPAAMAMAEIEVVQGRAFNDQGQLVYTERHTITYRDGRVLKINTVYTDADRVPIGKTVSDFSENPELGNYDFSDHRLNYYDGARVYKDRIAIFCRETPHADMQLKYLPREGNQVLGQGFNQFLIGNLDALASGDVIRAKLVLPAKQDQFDVVIRKDRIDANLLQIRVDVDSWFLKLFVPHIEAVFDLDTRRLVIYRGVSMISNESGDTTGVNVTYDYRKRTTVVRKDK